MNCRSVTVRVPATSANLGPGFDCLGLALDLWAEVTVTTESDAVTSPDDPAARMVVESARAAFPRAGRAAPERLAAVYKKQVPVARGLGASACARAAGILAANTLLASPLPPEELLALGSELEGHADNMAPALFGGFQVVVREGEQWLHASVSLPEGLKAVLFVPDFHMSTDESRKLLPQSLSRQDAVHNIGRAALLVAALASGRLELLDAATRDRLHQPARAKIFPAMEKIFAAARESGALGAFLSGGGSTILALASGGEEAIGRAMAAAAAQQGVTGEILLTAPASRGAFIVETS